MSELTIQFGNTTLMCLERSFTIPSRLSGGRNNGPAIRAEGSLYCLRVATAGYGHAVAKKIFDPDTKTARDELVAGPNLAEFIGDRRVSGFGGLTGALKLPVVETPEPALPAVREWTNVARFASHKRGNDWSPAVQAAIDSGARVVYFPRQERFEFHTPIRLHAPLERLVGFGGEVNWAESAWKRPDHFEQADPTSAPPALLIYDEPDPEHVLIIDRLGCQHVRHASPGTLVLRSSSPGRYSTGMAGGRLFAEARMDLHSSDGRQK